MSYFKYAERSSESRVDWNEISKGMVDMLKEQTRLRNEKLDEAVKLQGEVTTTLSEAPMGSDVNANQRVAEFAADAQEYSLMMNKLWRSGQMSYREYMAATNNFKTNTEGYLSQAEKYAANYEKHVKRMEEQIASGVEVSELARVEDFGNFSKFTPVIDAPTGSIGLVGEDGQQYASMTQLGVAVMATYDRLDVVGLTGQAVDSLAEVIRPFRDAGIESLNSLITPRDEDGEPIGELTEYEKSEDEIVGGILDTSDNATTSVLVDYTNLGYETTHLDSQKAIEAAANDPKMVVMVPSPRNKNRAIGSVEDDVSDADFDAYLEQAQVPEELRQKLRDNRKAQKDKAFDAVRNRIRTGLKFEAEATDIQEYKAPSAEVIRLQQAAAERSSDLGDWMEMLTADRNRQDALANALTQTASAKEAGIVKIDPTDPQDIVIHIDTDGDGVGNVTQTVRRIEVGEDVDGMASSLRNWARMGRIIHGVGGDESDAILDARNLTGTVTTEEGETQDVELVTASREAPLEPGGFEQPIEDFDTGTVTGSYTQAGGTSEGKTEAVEVPAETFYLQQTANGDMNSIVNAASSVVRQLSNEQLDSTYITGIAGSDIEQKAGDLGDGVFDTFYNTVSFFIPGVMDREVYIPGKTMNGAEQREVVRDLMKLAIQKARQGERLTTAELERFWQSYGDEQLSQYNNSLPTLYGMSDAPRRRSRTEAPVGGVPRANR